MYNKQQIVSLIERAGLNPVSKKFVEMVLRNFEDKEIIPQEKIEAISKVIEAEDKVRRDMAKRSTKKVAAWNKLILDL